MPPHFEYRPITEEMAYEVSQALALSIRTRIHSGVDVRDQIGPPLNPGRRLRNGRTSAGYPGLKQRRGLQAIRDWTFTGRTLAALVPVERQDGAISVGFDDSRAATIAAVNNYYLQKRFGTLYFGVSPSDRAIVTTLMNEIVRTGRLVGQVQVSSRLAA